MSLPANISCSKQCLKYKAFPQRRKHTKFAGKWFHIRQCQTKICSCFRTTHKLWPHHYNCSLDVWNNTRQNMLCLAEGLAHTLIHWHPTPTWTNALSNGSQKIYTKKEDLAMSENKNYHSKVNSTMPIESLCQIYIYTQEPQQAW